MYTRQTLGPGNSQELAVWQPWRVGPGARNYRGLGQLGDDTASGILSSVTSSDFSVNSTLLLAGVGVIALIFLLRGAGNVRRSYRASARKRKQRRSRIQQLKSELAAI